MAANKLDEANNMGNHGAQETHYTEEELLQALDLVEAPSNFVDHQWELYKSHLRAPISKVLMYSSIQESTFTNMCFT